MKTISSQSVFIRFLKTFLSNAALIIAGLGFIILGLGYFYSTKNIVEVEKSLDLVEIAVAKSMIPYGTRLSEDLFESKLYPSDYLPVNSISLEDVNSFSKEEKYINANYFPGEIVTITSLSNEPFTTKTALFKPELGQEYFEIDNNDIQQLPSLLKPGDTISIYTLEDTKIFDRKRILGVDNIDISGTTSPSYIILGLTPEEISTIIKAINNTEMIRVSKHETE